MNFIKKFHKTTYPAINPGNPGLSQAGKTVLVAGASTGIGFSIAEAFVMAAASKVILLARRQQVLSSAVAELTKKSSGFSCSISGFECDISDPAAVNALWDKLEGDGVEIDILALSAASNGRSAQILEMGSAEIWKVYEANVRGNLLFTERFAQHTQRSRLESPNVLLNVSSMGIHDRQIAPQWGTYVSSKSAFAMLLQNIASEIPKNVMQIISFHPGGIYSETQSKICEKDSWEWDDGE
jgi:NAD(P)-dependent dehydrogenase (short-subunit alcohol dehydrogenase family)